MLAGFPCQAFSIAGKRRGFIDTRGTLFFDVARILKDKRPKYFVLENVKGLLNHDNGKTFQTILRILSNIGIYSIEWALLNSKFFGVPQNRERVFIVGYPRKYGIGKIFPLAIAARENNRATQTVIYWKNSKEKWVCENRNDVGTLRTQTDLCRQPLIVQLSRGNNKGGIKELCPTISKSQWEYNNLLVENKPKVIGGIGEKNFGKQFRQDNRIYSSNAPSPCLSSHSGNASKGSVCILDTQKIIRRLSPLECFRLQGYSDEVFYKGSKGIPDTQLYKIAGNSVTVNVVYEIIKKIIDIENEAKKCKMD